MIEKLLKLGLSDNEAKVYLAMLELGPATVIEISAKAGINRPTTYVQIENLKKLGLASTQLKGKKTLYIPESPDHLEMVLRNEADSIQNKKHELEASLPRLMALFQSSDNKPQVRFFEGKEGIAKIQDEFLKNKSKEVISISSADDVIAVFPNHPQKYTTRRVQAGIKSRLIYTSQKGPFLKNDSALLREVRFLSADKFKFALDMTVYDDTVAIANLRGSLFGVIIKNEAIADSFKNLLNLIWESAEAVN